MYIFSSKDKTLFEGKHLAKEGILALGININDCISASEV